MVGLLLEKPGIKIGAPDYSIRVEWKNLLFNIGELFIHGFLAAATGGGTIPSAITSAVSAAQSFRVDESVQSRAYALVALSFAYAIDALRPAGGQPLPDGLAVEIGIAMQEALETEAHFLDPNFFQQPTEFSLYRAAKPMLVSTLATLRTGTVAEVSGKLDAAFSAAVYRVLSIKPEYFERVVAELSNPAFGAANLEFEWARYRTRLIESFEVDPIFGQESTKISLSQLYVPCKAIWYESDEYDEDDKVEYIDDLFDLVSSWVDNFDVDDCIRVVSGGPGSGKSSFAKYLASTFAAREAVRPIFIELQKLGEFADLQGAIYRRLVREQQFFSTDPLENKESGRPFLLVFDGLDELVVPGGDAAKRTAESFATALHGLLRVLNGGRICRALALVTGRTSIAQVFDKAANGKVPQTNLEVSGFVGLKPEKFDLRPTWWRQYAEAFSLSSEIPEAFKTSKLASVTNEPLLCYLLAVSGYALEGWEAVADNHNKIFDKLLGEIWERKWGKEGKATSGRVGPALALDKRSDFDSLMETVALAAWWGGESRVASKGAFDRALDATASRSAWSKFKQDNGDALGNLALTFYFRGPDTGAQGIEFSHKSFGEYLVARFIIRTLNAKISTLLRSDSIELLEGAERWARVASDAILTEDIRPFLENEAKILSEESRKICAEEGSRLLSKVLPHGLDVNKSLADGVRELAKKSTIGITNLATGLQYLSQGFSYQYFPDKFTSVDDATNLVRDASNFYVSNRGLKPAFVNMNLGAVFLNGAFLLNFDFSRSNLKGANFVSSNVGQVKFCNCDLRASSFSHASAGSADFTDADIRGTSFENAHIHGAIFDVDWISKVDPRTFKQPPHGLPRIKLLDGSVIDNSSSYYPDLDKKYIEMNKFYETGSLVFQHESFYKGIG